MIENWQKMMKQIEEKDSYIASLKIYIQLISQVLFVSIDAICGFLSIFTIVYYQKTLFGAFKSSYRLFINKQRENNKWLIGTPLGIKTD